MGAAKEALISQGLDEEVPRNHEREASDVETTVPTTGSSIGELHYLREVLAEAPVFQELAPRDLDMTVSLMQWATYEPGASLCRQGDKAPCLYVLLKGEITATTRAKRGSGLIVKKYRRPGDFFADCALTRGTVQQASLTCTQTSIVLWISRDDLASTLGPLRELLLKKVSKLADWDVAVSCVAILVIFVHVVEWLLPLVSYEDTGAVNHGPLGQGSWLLGKWLPSPGATVAGESHWAIMRQSDKIDRILISLLLRTDIVVCGLFFIDFALLHARQPCLTETSFLVGVLELAASIPMGWVIAPMTGHPLGLLLVRHGQGFRALQMLRVWRAVEILVRRFYSRAEASSFRAVVFFSMATWLLGAMAVRVFEASDPSSPFRGADVALWWSLATMATVGYGDAVPASFGGRVMGLVLMLFGISIFGLLSGLTVAHFLGLNDLTPDARARHDHRVLSEIRTLREEVAELREGPRFFAALPSGIEARPRRRHTFVEGQR